MELIGIIYTLSNTRPEITVGLKIEFQLALTETLWHWLRKLFNEDHPIYLMRSAQVLIPIQDFTASILFDRPRPLHVKDHQLDRVRSSGGLWEWTEGNTGSFVQYLSTTRQFKVLHIRHRRYEHIKETQGIIKRYNGLKGADAFRQQRLQL